MPTTDEKPLAELAQESLKRRGFYTGKIDGDWGPQSKAAYAAHLRKTEPAFSALGQLPWMAVANGELGQAEVPGDRDNPRIVEYHQATSLKATDDETPWCSSFVNWALGKVGITGSRSAMARSFLEWGKTLPMSNPPFGAIVVFRRGAPPKGHVAFFLGLEGNRVRVLGGNQGNKVSITTFPVSDVLGYRWPEVA